MIIQVPLYKNLCLLNHKLKEAGCGTIILKNLMKKEKYVHIVSLYLIIEKNVQEIINMMDLQEILVNTSLVNMELYHLVQKELHLKIYHNLHLMILDKKKKRSLHYDGFF